MTALYIISDTHFGHAAILGMKRTFDGKPLRNFATVDEMDEHIVARWNEIVRPCDHVYHLGDVTMTWRNLAIVKRLKGHKRLVRGNHDIFQTRKYIDAGFEEIYGVRVFPEHKLILSHIPIHSFSLKPEWINVHGHLHNNFSVSPFTRALGPFYFNASVETLEYKPISLEQLHERLREL